MSRVVYVTGAASGNGWCIADRFLKAGDNVIAVDLDGAALEQRRKEDWADFDKQLLCQQGDVTSEDVVDATVAAGREAFGQIDILVNNAGITGNQDATVVHVTPMEEYDRVMAVNVRSIFLICRAVLPEMMERGRGIILNIASVAGMVAFPGRAAYVASKGAVIQLTRSITADYGHYGIRALALCPGMIETPMTKWRLDQPEMRKAVLDRIPQREIGRPEDVADAVFYLAGPEAHYFNGAALAMDGGYVAM
jgi:NAD(P)-dependent dehydrogenase (short-subunit alcohol dehydrogenase family)